MSNVSEFLQLVARTVDKESWESFTPREKSEMSHFILGAVGLMNQLDEGKNMIGDKNKTYLGDGVYAWYDGFHIVLETNNETGFSRVYLEPSALDNLDVYKAKMFKLNTSEPKDFASISPDET